MVWLMYIVCALSITKSFQLQHKFVPTVSEECEKIGVCEDVENYPEEYVNKIVKQMEESGDDTWIFEKSDAKIDIIKNENSTTDKEKSLCKSEMKFITPRAARTGKGVWQFVINTLDRRQQPILIETCSYDSLDHMCGNDVSIEIHQGYNFTCRQKYAFRQTLGLDHNGKVVDSRYLFPNCCDCVGSHTHDNIKDDKPNRWE